MKHFEKTKLANDPNTHTHLQTKPEANRKKQKKSVRLKGERKEKARRHLFSSFFLHFSLFWGRGGAATPLMMLFVLLGRNKRQSRDPSRAPPKKKVMNIGSANRKNANTPPQQLITEETEEEVEEEEPIRPRAMKGAHRYGRQRWFRYLRPVSLSLSLSFTSSVCATTRCPSGPAKVAH